MWHCFLMVIVGMITGDSWRVNMANKLVAMGCIFLSGEDGYNVMHGKI